MEKLKGYYFRKQFDPPKYIGENDKPVEQISIFPPAVDDCFIDVKGIKGKNKITINFNGKEWSGTMKQLANKLFK